MPMFFGFFFFFFRKIKQFHSSKVSFPKRFSSSDHLNAISTNISMYFDYLLAKTKQKYGHHKETLRLRACLFYRKNIIETVVFVLGKNSQIAF